MSSRRLSFKMRLINVETLQLETFAGGTEVPYAILSHCWGEDEVLFQDMFDGNAPWKKGYAKIQRFCAVARSEGLRYVWIDTCCIDKSSSAELSEAVNSMFCSYRQASVCFAYLHDCPSNAFDGTVREDHFDASKWFTRGWTLQELVVPADVVFLSAEWKEFGTRRSLSNRISIITNIPAGILAGTSTLASYSVAQTLSWAAERVTTRPEDRAYSLMGLLDVHMPVIYGEGGEQAFLRLQQEILRRFDDQTILAWELSPNTAVVTGLLAPSPDCFRNCATIEKAYNEHQEFCFDGFYSHLLRYVLKVNGSAVQIPTPDDDKTSLMTSPGGMPPADQWFAYINTQLCKFSDERWQKYTSAQKLSYGHELREGVQVLLLDRCANGRGTAVSVLLCRELGEVCRVHLPKPPRSMPEFDLSLLPGLSRQSFHVLAHYKGLQEEPIPAIRLWTQLASYRLQSSSPEFCAPQEPCPDHPHWCVKGEKRSLAGAGDGFTPLLQLGRLFGGRPTGLQTFSLCFHPKPELFTGHVLPPPLPPPPFRLVFHWGLDSQIRMAFRVGRDAEADGSSYQLPDASGVVNFAPQTHRLNDDLAVVVKLRQGADHNYQLQVVVEGTEAVHHGKSGISRHGDKAFWDVIR